MNEIIKQLLDYQNQIEKELIDKKVIIKNSEATSSSF